MFENILILSLNRFHTHTVLLLWIKLELKFIFAFCAQYNGYGVVSVQRKSRLCSHTSFYLQSGTMAQ